MAARARTEMQPAADCAKHHPGHRDGARRSQIVLRADIFRIGTVCRSAQGAL